MDTERTVTVTERNPRLGAPWMDLPKLGSNAFNNERNPSAKGRAGGVVGKREPPALLGGGRRAATAETARRVLRELKMELPTTQRSHVWVCIRRTQDANSEEYMRTHGHRSVVYQSHGTGPPRCPPAAEGKTRCCTYTVDIARAEQGRNLSVGDKAARAGRRASCQVRRVSRERQIP